MEKHWSNERQSPTWTINEKLITPENREEVMAYAKARQEEYEAIEAKRIEEKKQAELRKYPTLRAIFDRIKISSSPHIKNAILKRLHIILDYLKMPALPDEMEPTLEYSLGLLGRAEISLSLIEEIGKILSDASGYSVLRVYPREAVQLREHMRDQQRLARQIVLAIAFQKIKETGVYEPKAKVNTGEPVPDKGQGIVGTGS